MAEKANEISSEAADLFKYVFDAMWLHSGPPDAWHWFMLLSISAIVAIISFYFLLKAAKAAFEALSKVVEAYKGSGLPLWLGDDDKRKVRRRAQFCSVIDADLAYIAKAESWNDQYFTDLEAEVESDGGYYASAWNRLRRKRSFGLRKERSLMKAIASSTEKAIQLVGEPGAGKSVALRHLAKQFAERGKKSKDKNAIVPLYINLRELDVDDVDSICANDIKNFVLENIRRGDSDTSAYVRENWDDYRERGIWLFLLDSFDEIPAVLHAETGSIATRKFSEAVRQFLEGMGDCKGVLASREFKGPEALPWTKFRILPLTADKQDELVQNSFLSKEQMAQVRHHLVISDNSLKATPLFLTLLCRFVREESRPPATDYDLLERHIERLARRDAIYIERKYGLSSDELIKGAGEIARIFAENLNMSLSPSIDQLSVAISESPITCGNIYNLVSALVDSKIGRADFPNALPGDRKFAFSHRRYQETLFVKYLANNPGHLSPRELLTNSRWREYAVTLLQTRAPSELFPFLTDAEEILLDSARRQVCRRAEPPLGRDFGYYEWGGLAPYLLQLLQEGIAGRHNDIPASLSEAVEKFLRVRWDDGDLFDRIQVVKLGALLPNDTLGQYISKLFDIATDESNSTAFRQTVYIARIPSEIRGAILSRLATETLDASGRAARLRIEALASRLPNGIGASYVLERCARLKPFYATAKKIGSHIVPVLQFNENVDGGFRLSLESAPIGKRLIVPFGMMIMSIFVIFPAIFGAGTMLKSYFNGGFSLSNVDGEYALFLVPLFLYVRYVLLYAFRARGERMGVKALLRRVASGNFISKFSVFCAALSVAIAFTAGCFYIAGWGVIQIANRIGIAFVNDGDEFVVGLVACVVCVYISILVSTFRDVLRLRSEKARLHSLSAGPAGELEIMLMASNLSELMHWLNIDRSLLVRVEVIRSISSLAEKLEEPMAQSLLPELFTKANLSIYARRRLSQILEDALVSVSGDRGMDAEIRREAMVPDAKEKEVGMMTCT